MHNLGQGLSPCRNQKLREQLESILILSHSSLNSFIYATGSHEVSVNSILKCILKPALHMFEWLGEMELKSASGNQRNSLQLMAQAITDCQQKAAQ